MIDKILKLVNPQLANAVNSQNKQDEFNKILQLKQTVNEAEVPFISNVDFNSYKMRGTLDDNLNLDDNNVLKTIISQIMANPSFLNSAIEKLKQKMSNVPV